MLIGVSFLNGLGVVDRVSGCFLETCKVLNVVFDMRIVRIRMSIRSRRVIAVVEIERGFVGTSLLSVVLSKLEGRQKHFPILVLQTKGFQQLLDDLHCCFRLSIRLGVR